MLSIEIYDLAFYKNFYLIFLRKICLFLSKTIIFQDLQTLITNYLMGNEIKGQNLASFKKKTFAFDVNKVPLKVKLPTQGVKFQPSPYNIEQERYVVKPFMDKTVRDSEFCFVSMPELSDESQKLIQAYLLNLNNFSHQYDQVNKEWRMTRYLENGHFLEHCDRQKLMNGHLHFGTQIFLPPYSETTFKGGQLKVTYGEEVIEILPDQNAWIHIILPLGIEHQVKKVTKGTRISFVKEIWVKDEDEQIETDQDRQIKEAERTRRHIRIGRLD